MPHEAPSMPPSQSKSEEQLRSFPVQRQPVRLQPARAPMPPAEAPQSTPPPPAQRPQRSQPRKQSDAMPQVFRRLTAPVSSELASDELIHQARAATTSSPTQFSPPLTIGGIPHFDSGGIQVSAYLESLLEAHE